MSKKVLILSGSPRKGGNSDILCNEFLRSTPAMAQRTELDYLIYNDPLGYADLILNGDPKEYLKNVAGSHGLED